VFWEPAGICLFGWALVWYLSGKGWFRKKPSDDN
jgi:hypothetical protein